MFTPFNSMDSGLLHVQQPSWYTPSMRASNQPASWHFE
jgi:hypothetical protein